MTEKLSIRQRVADLLWSLPFEDTGGTLTLRDAEFGAEALDDSGFLVSEERDDEEPSVVQWGVGTKKEDTDDYVVVMAHSEAEARRIARHEGRKVVKRRVTKWEVVPDDESV